MIVVLLPWVHVGCSVSENLVVNAFHVDLCKVSPMWHYKFRNCVNISNKPTKEKNNIFQNKIKLLNMYPLSTSWKSDNY